jgi:hypothetical protein
MSNICAEPVAAEIWAMYSRSSVWYPCSSTRLSDLRQTEAGTLLKIPGYAQISSQPFPASCYNTSKSLIGVEYTKASMSFHGQKIHRNEVRRSCRPVDWTSVSYPRYTESLVQLVSDNVERMRVSRQAWTPCVVVDEEERVPRVLATHSPKHDGTLHLLVC